MPRSFRIRVLFMQATMVVCTVAFWEYAALHRLANPMFIGQPTIIADLMLEQARSGVLLRATWITLAETLSGFIAGLVIGAFIGLALWWSPLAGRVMEPMLVVFNAVPKIALAPIFIVVLGIGFAMKVSLAFTNVVVLFALTAYTGAKQADPDLMDLICSFGGSRWRMFWMIVLPTSLMWIVSTLEIGLGLAFVGAVTGEFLAAREGLGYLALYGSNIFNMNLIWVAVFSMMAVTVCMAAIVRRLESHLLSARPQSTSP
jgi:NitT/TauT family transport system permease protein